MLTEPKLLYATTLLFFILGCKDTTTVDAKGTYFGGQIINPKDSHVYLYKKDVLVDSVALDNDNKFLIELENVEEGLYNFKHSPEYQYVYIKPQDSVLIRLNTIEFDESLVFTGNGAGLNNFLIEMYLIHEDEESLMRKLFKKPHDLFIRSLDSLVTMKKEQLDELLEDKTLTDGQQKIAKASLEFPYYQHKETYPYLHRNLHGKDHFEQLPANFYAYRDKVDYNDELLSHFRPYLNFLITNISNRSYTIHADMKYENSLEFNLNRVNLIDSIIVNEQLKNNLLRYFSYDFLLGNQDIEENEVYLKEYFSISTSNEHDREIDKLYHSIRDLQTGKQLPDIKVATQRSKFAEVQNLLGNRKTRVYYFWSMDQKKHLKNVLKHVYKLQKKYPDIQFVGINVNKDHKKWIGTCEKMDLPFDGQYRAVDFDKMSKELVLNTLNKAIIVDKDNKIINGFANINDLGNLDNM